MGEMSQERYFAQRPLCQLDFLKNSGNKLDGYRFPRYLVGSGSTVKPLVS